jgi:hypothetical protein
VLLPGQVVQAVPVAQAEQAVPQLRVQLAALAAHQPLAAQVALLMPAD